MVSLPKSIKIAPEEGSYAARKAIFFSTAAAASNRGKRRLSSKLRSIQVTITLTFTSVAVLVAVVVSLMLYNKFAKTAEENANMNMQQIIEQVNYNLELYVKGMRNIFETAEDQITNSPSVDSAL